MASYFRRGRRGPFKHIAHGLVPAATIAPKPAVPRTPPPRSPNPSPERPRSALAAAILVTTLTGRTVAIPQPRQRSLSESDASTLQDRESCIEPYATITELRMGRNWKSDGDDKSVQSLGVSGSCCEDEDMDTFASDSEKEPGPNYQVIDDKNTSMSSDASYAVPHKTKEVNFQEDFPMTSSTEGQEDEPTCLIHPDVQVEEVEPPDVQFKVEKLSSENLLNEKPPSSSDVAVRRKQGQVNLPREKFQRLQEEHWHLNEANRSLFSQLEEAKQQMKELQLKAKEVEKENRGLREAAQNSHSEEELAELLSLRQQAQELVDENDSLKMTVHRLNVELSRYQAKYRPISPNEGLKLGSLPMKKPVPPWLLDMKYLSPLLLAYEDRMREKEDLILAHEEDMRNFKAQVEEVVKENEQLHQQLSKNSSFTTKEWQLLQGQAKLVLEENALLMEQLKIQETKAKENHNQHVEEVCKLTKQLMILEAEKHNQEEEKKESRKQLEELRCAYKELKASIKDCITVKEHAALVNQLKSQLQQEQEKRETELQELMGKLASVQAEKKSLLIEKNNLGADNKALEAELEMAQKTKRQSQRKMGLLKQQLEEATEKEMTARQYLANLISLAEHITQERDHLLNLASCLENEKHGVLNKIVEGNIRLGRLEEKVKMQNQCRQYYRGSPGFEISRCAEASERSPATEGNLNVHHQSLPWMNQTEPRY